MAWSLAVDAWAKRDKTEIPASLGNILGCGLATFTSDRKPDQGKDRLYQILILENAYLIWKLRNKRRIRDNKGPNQSEEEVQNRWT